MTPATPADDGPRLVKGFHKSSFSGSNGSCVHVRHYDDGSVDVWESANGHRMHIPAGSYSAFVRGVKNNEFDPPAPPGPRA